MRADDDVDLTGGEVECQLFSFAGRHRPRQQCHPHLIIIREQRTQRHLIAEEVLNGAEMLSGEHFCGREHRGLSSRIDGSEHRTQRHDGLAGADVAVEQAMHRRSPADVCLDLLSDPQL